MAKDYRISTRRTVSGVWQNWTAFSSIGPATSHAVSIEPGGSVYFNVLIMCSGSSDGKIYPRGTLAVTHRVATYSDPVVPSGWVCSGNPAVPLKNCVKTWVVSKKQSRKAHPAIDKIVATATSELALNQTPAQAALGVDASRVENGRLQVTVKAKVAGSQVPYSDGTFTPR